MSDADSEVRAAFRALLTAERAGYKLATALVSTLVTYLVGSVELSDVSELEISELLTTAEEAWASTHDGEELPIVHRQRLARWIANVPASISVEGDNAVALSSSTGSMTEDMSKLFGDAGASTQDLARLAEDKKAQGLSGARIIRLALALELGRLPAIGDVLGVVPYGSNLYLHFQHLLIPGNQAKCRVWKHLPQATYQATRRVNRGAQPRGRRALAPGARQLHPRRGRTPCCRRRSISRLCVTWCPALATAWRPRHSCQWLSSPCGELRRQARPALRVSEIDTLRRAPASRSL